ncbi:MAG: hypothetical protein WDN29_01125 [Methylovirgula sp.]
MGRDQRIDRSRSAGGHRIVEALSRLIERSGEFRLFATQLVNEVRALDIEHGIDGLRALAERRMQFATAFVERGL